MLAVLMGMLTVPGTAGERRVVEAIMARVNDKIITVTDFRKRLRQDLSQIPRQLSSEEIRSFAHRIFDDMVNELVLMERAKEKKIEVTREDVDRAIEGLRKQNNLTDDDAFKEALASAGLTEAVIRERYRRNMLLQRVVQSEMTATEITAQELLDEYNASKEKYRTPEKVHLEQVFFPVAEDAKDREAVLGRARGLVERVRKGADFKAEATLAGLEVQDLGEIPVSDLRDEIKDALQGLEEGGITDVISTGGGFQVIRLVARIPAGYQPFEEVKEQIRRGLSEKRYREQSEGLVKKLREDYLVETHPEMVDQVLEGTIGE